MKKKSTSQSAFFNPRFLIGAFVALAGISLALFATANPVRPTAAQAQQKYKVTTQSSIDPLVPAGFDCSKIHRLGIDRQENLRAGAVMIFCGLSEGGKASTSGGKKHFFKLVKSLTAPLAFGSTDVDLITGTESFPNVTQSETFTTANPDDPNQVVVAYNDSRGRNFTPINISGASVSTDGGLTFTRLTKANGQSPFDNTFGDPVVLYHKPSGTWVTVWLDGACGGQGLGGYKTTTPTDPNSWTHFCAFNEGSADRESGWADNNPSSPFFGRLYISWNDFNIGQGALMSIFSTDGGSTWSSPATVINGGTFIRDVQITGDLAGSGTTYIAGMDEGGGGFPHNDTNLIFKSTDGGSTWSNTYTGTPFPGPGVTASGYFACMFTDFGAYWRHEGWGEPAAINNFVHLVYAQHGAGSDPGDVYYIRSTDGGVTFGAPVLLNTDGGTRPQWQPNLSVSPTGTLLATWYDARESASCVAGDPGTPCYRMWSRKSNDNGASWLPDDMLSDVVTPLPEQPDPGIQPTYAGDYDYGSAIASKHVTSWTDGRVTISGTSQQDAFTDRDLVGFSVATADPACGSLVIGTAPTDFQIILSDPADPSTVQASDFTVNGTPADTANLSNGNQTIDFIFNSSPVVQGENTMHIDAGAIHQASNNDPILEFNCTFRFAVTQLAVTDTDPPVGGTFTPPAPGTYDYLVNLNMAADPSSVQDSDLQLSGNTGATVTGHTLENGDTTIHFTLHMDFGGTLTASIAAGAITDQFGNPGAAFSGNYTVEGPTPCLWSSGPDLPFAGTRFVGVFFPANGKFYAMGGRDVNNIEFTHPFEYDPGSNSWTTKSATYPDNHVNNMACSVLNDSGTDYIYCAGGSEFTGQTTSGHVFRYDPVADSITTVPSNWPPGDNGTLPGGFTVFNNKLYTLGGFDIPNGSGTNQIWEFTPNPAGWVQKNAVLPFPLGYLPTTTIGNLIYTGGGVDITGGVLTDTNHAFIYDPVADSISINTDIPDATSNTRAVNFCNVMYVLGGNFNAPTNEVQIYDPVSGTWSVGPPFAIAGRNFAADTDGTNNIWKAGGYDSGLAIIATMEIFNCPNSPCAAPTPTPTPTSTPTPTPTATPTPTPRPVPTPRPRPTPHPRP